MRYKKRGRSKKPNPSHRQAILRDLVISLFEHGRVITKQSEVREACALAEKLVTLAKDGSMHARRRAISLLHDENAVSSLFSEIGPRYTEHPGGYSRTVQLAEQRSRFQAPQVCLELVEVEKMGESETAPGAVAVTTPGTQAEEVPGVEVGDSTLE